MFRKAERKKAKLRLGICGPSGSGKTYSALLIAQGIGGKVAMIDTENGSGDLYSHVYDYDIATIEAPFSPDKYVKTIHEAEKAGYDVLIIDSLTHAWSGEGGILEMHDKVASSSRGGNSYTAWRTVTPKHNSLIDAMLQSSVHIIATMRTKTAYDMVDDKGKKKPVKVGLAPVQREGMDYEFTTVIDLSVNDHVASVSKDRTGLFDGQFFVPSIKDGERLLSWLNSGSDVKIENVKPELHKPKATKPNPVKKTEAKTPKAGLTEEQDRLKDVLFKSFDINPESGNIDNDVIDKIASKIESLSSFKNKEGKEIKGKRSIRDLSDPRCQVVRHIIEKEMKEVADKKEKVNDDMFEHPEDHQGDDEPF